MLSTWERETAHSVGSLIAYMHNLQEGYDIVASEGSPTMMVALLHPLRTGFLGGEIRLPSSNVGMRVTLVQVPVRWSSVSQRRQQKSYEKGLLSGLSGLWSW